jgi:threonine/homoserine/homoserine lactone efflux protein
LPWQVWSVCWYWFIPYFALLTGFVGGGYLARIVAEVLRHFRNKNAPDSVTNVQRESPPMASYRIGLLTNLTNPKAWAFSES